MVPPDDEELGDLGDDRGDAVYQKGVRIAEEIRGETSLQGRMRRPLLARLEEQRKQQNLRSTTGRARTSRTLGGGVVRCATTSIPTATVPTTISTTVRTTTGTITISSDSSGTAALADATQQGADGEMQSCCCSVICGSNAAHF